MALSRDIMNDEHRKSVAIEYLKAFDNGGVTSTGGSIMDLFADDAQVYFPKWGLATGKDQIGQMFGDVGGTIKQIVHHYSHFNWVFSGGDVIVAEGESHGEHRDGPWRAGEPEWSAGRWCDVFEIRDWLIQRVLHLPRPGLRRQGHRALPLARRQDLSWGCGLGQARGADSVAGSPATRVWASTRGSLGSYGRPRCRTQRLSHITRSPTCQLWA